MKWCKDFNLIAVLGLIKISGKYTYKTDLWQLLNGDITLVFVHNVIVLPTSNDLFSLRAPTTYGF